ncbi:MAG TPA: amidohydrolase [Thermoanaerobaculia bacterium]|jgi:hippurate hydrolase|nr:amidohydrolase [Thermoanaerobaculia bacterium]
MKRIGIVLLFIASSVAAQNLDQMIDREIPSLLTTYKQLHAAPELSMQEKNSSALVASRLKELGYEVTYPVGQYTEPGATCYGVVAIMRNGNGPTLLVRSDMDALPVQEQTGLPYASTVRAKSQTGDDVPVMHACGHDIHMTTLLGTAKMLAQMKSQWHGTLMLIGQPAEEVVKGADGMLRDRLYERFPKPDYAIALHDNASLPAGQIGYTPGYLMASADSINVTIRGLGGHGASPQSTKDPVVMSAQFINALQTIVSREDSPLDPVVVTVGSIHGGTKRNIIPDEVQLLMTVRTYKPEVRKRVVASIERIARGIAMSAGVPEDRMPLVELLAGESVDSTYNDPALTERIASALTKGMGAANVIRIDPLMVSEDFGRFGIDRKIPICMINLGAVDPAKIASGQRLPSLHSSGFAPLPDPTLRGGIKAMTLAVLELLH